MFAIIETGSKQYKVQQGDVIEIELTDIQADAQEIVLDKVLYVSNGDDVKIGAPYLQGAKVTGKFKTSAGEGVVKGIKLYPMTFRNRKNSKCRVGHRQKHLSFTVEKIEA